MSSNLQQEGNTGQTRCRAQAMELGKSFSGQEELLDVRVPQPVASTSLSSFGRRAVYGCVWCVQHVRLWHSSQRPRKCSGEFVCTFEYTGTRDYAPFATVSAGPQYTHSPTRSVRRNVIHWRQIVHVPQVPAALAWRTSIATEAGSER